MKKEKLYMAVVMLLLVSVTTIVYSPGLEGIFLFDDKPNIVDNKGLILEDYSLQSFINAALSGSSTLKRPVSMFSFALNIEVCGKSPSCFKVVNLIIHIICGFLIFILTRLALARYSKIYKNTISEQILLLVAASVSLLWLLHPINLTSVLYAVQRMNSLSASFSLIGMILYILGRDRLLNDDSGRTLIVLAFLMTIPAVLSKENGILLPLFLLLIEIFLFKFQCASVSNKKLLKLAFILSTIAPAILITGLLIANPEWLLQKYAYREFNLYERLLSEARIFWIYIGLIFLPSNQDLSLFHDYIEISRGLFEPVSTFYSIIALLAVIAVILYTRKRLPLLSFGLLFFICGHLVESTFIPLELVFEHRNYLPSIGLILPFCYYLLHNRISLNTLYIRRIALGCMILLFGVVTNLRASQWGNPLLLVELEVRNNANSPRVHNLAGNIYVSLLKRATINKRDEYYQKALRFFSKSSRLDPKNTSGLVSTHILMAREKGKHDIELFREVVKRLNTKKITATDTVSVKQLVACVEKDICRNDVVDIGELGKSIDTNPYESGRYKAIAYAIIGSYYWNNNVDKELALYYTEKAVETYKDSRTLNLNYAKLLVAMGFYDKAKPVLAEVKRSDYFNINRPVIRQLEIEINNNGYRAIQN